MERKKWWASLIAVAVGLAFSVGSASAYQRGDFATDNEGKLIPYYMTSDNLATIIGVDDQTPLDAGEVSIIEVRVLNEVGAMQASGQLCLSSQNQFGYAILRQEMMMKDDMDMDMDMDMMRVSLMLGVGDTVTTVYGDSQSMSGVSGRAGSDQTTTPMEGDIEAEGYVVVTYLGQYTTADPATPDTDDTDDGCDSEGSLVDAATGVPTGDADSSFAAWAILQDVGEGFFGTEIPSLTVNTEETIVGTAVTEMDRVDCATDTAACEGLVAGAATTAITVRFDNSMSNYSKSMVYVWMDTSEVYATSGERNTRDISVEVHCEGMEMTTMRMPLPDRINVIDAMDLGCEGRGTARISTTAAASTPSAVAPNVASAWSHISQMGGGFRMNFEGYAAGP